MPQNRTKSGQFLPGTSGNPGGRPVKTKEQKDALAAIQTLSTDAADILRSLLRNKATPPSLRVRICELILDRTYGKPQQHVQAAIMNRNWTKADVKIEIGEDGGAWVRMTDEEVQAWMEAAGGNEDFELIINE